MTNRNRSFCESRPEVVISMGVQTPAATTLRSEPIPGTRPETSF